MTLRPYSANPGRLALQVVADLFVLAWIYLWSRIGGAVHDGIASAAGVGYRVQGGAGQVADNLDQAGRNTARPSPRRRLAEHPPARSGGAGGGHRGQRSRPRRPPHGVGRAGRLARRARTDLDHHRLLAARAAAVRPQGGHERRAGHRPGRAGAARPARAHQPPVSTSCVASRPTPLAAWRSGDPDAVRALAALELTAAGVRPPTRPSDRPPATAPATP